MNNEKLKNRRVSLTRSQSEAIEYLCTIEQLEKLDLGVTYLRGTVEQLEGVQEMLDADIMWDARLAGIYTDLSDGLLNHMERSVRRMVKTIDRKIQIALR